MKAFEDYELTRLRGYLKDYAEANLMPSPNHERGKFVCPYCWSGTGPNGSGAFSLDPDGVHWKCFACDESGDLFDLLGEQENIVSFPERVRRAQELYGIGGGAVMTQAESQAKDEPQTVKKEAAAPAREPRKDWQEASNQYISACAAQAHLTSYYHDRGLTDETVKQYKLGYDPERGAVVLPYGQAGYYMTRSTSEDKDSRNYRKPRTSDAGDEPPFHLESIYSDRPCFIVEGIFDALSIIQVGGLAFPLVGTAHERLIEQLKHRKPKAPLILALDQDERGRETQEKLTKELESIGVTSAAASWTLENYGGPKKDANDLLRANPQQLQEDVQRLESEARQLHLHQGGTLINLHDYVQSGAFGKDINYFKQYEHRKTGFSNLDQYLTLYPGLAVLGGSSGLGKTTFAINMADNLARKGETILFYSLEQEPIELATKFIARRDYERRWGKSCTNRDIKNGRTQGPDYMLTMHEFLETTAKNVHIKSMNFRATAQDIADSVEEFIRASGTRPIVIIDYLQMIAAPDEYKTADKRLAIDDTISTIKDLQRKHELFVLLISSFNRSSYLTPVSYESFKESGGIEYTADYMLGMQLSVLSDPEFYNQNVAKKSNIERACTGKDTTPAQKRITYGRELEKNPREVQVVGLKNRNGQASFTCDFKYYPAHDCFRVAASLQARATFEDVPPLADEDAPQSASHSENEDLQQRLDLMTEQLEQNQQAGGKR